MEWTIDGAIGTVFTLTMALVSAYFYNHKGKSYALDKTRKMESPASFRYVYRYIQFTTIIASIGSFLTNNRVFLEMHDNILLFYLGLSIASLAMVLFISAKLTLGVEYSPCFDSYLPRDIVQEGAYKFIRHPIYTSNIALLTGVFIASGSVWIIINLVLLLVYYVFSALKEEKILKKEFPAYRQYADRTNMFIPSLKHLYKNHEKIISSRAG